MLETLLKQIKDAEDRKKKLEEERDEATAQLHENQEKIKNLPKLSEVEMQKEMEKIQTLESKVRELAKKCDLESVLHEELSLEIQALQRAQAKASRNDPALQNPMTPNGTEPFLKSAGDLSVPACSACTIASTTTIVGTVAQTATISAVKDTAGPAAMQPQSHPYSGEAVGVLPQASSSIAVSPAVSVSSQAPVQTAPLESTSEIDRILARIEQDNRILAELENTRNIVGSSAPFPNLERSKLITEEVKKKEKEVSTALNIKQSVTIAELEKLMEKLEQDNRILAELDKKRSAMDSHFVTSTSHHALSTNVSEDGSLHHGASSFATPSPSLGSLNVAFSSHTPTVQARDSQRHQMPTSVSSAHSASNGALTEEDEMADYIDFIELPGRGRCQIYCARYSYDPLKQSPNENPEAELCLNAGDYIIIFGEMDEDGFFNGELLDGRKGLVPSNFVEKLTGEELYEFQSIVLYGNRDSDDSSVCFSYSADYEVVSAEDYLLPDDFHRMNDYIDLEDFDEDDEEGLSDSEKKNDGIRKAVPPPQRLILERQLNKSFLIGWLPPEDRSDTIEAYHVYVDGIPKATIQSAERTRALIEGVDSSKPHRISVRSVSSSGYHSNDAACTIVVGKDVPLAPTSVKASHVTSTTAIVSWLPSNSNFQHVIAVNSVEVKVIKPGRFRHRISGLSPNTVYRVSIRVRPGKLFNNEEKNHKKLQMLVSNVEFKTLPKGLPDPPVNVQVEQGPQDGTLLVTWMPVVPNQSSLHISPVTGYIVFAAGKSVAEIDSPSGDHALVDGCHLLGSNKKTVTVRSKCEEGLSSESLPCVIPTDLLRGFQKSLILSSRNEERTPRERRSSSSDSESDTELAELLNHVNRRARAFDPVDLSTFADKGDLPEDLPFEERSELSDIVEEEEEITVDAGEAKQRNLGSSNIDSSQMMDDSYGLSREEDINSPHTDLNQQQMLSSHTNVHSSPRRQYQPPSSSVISQRKQRWKEQSHTGRMREDDKMVPRQQRDMQNSQRKPSHSHNENRLENGIDSSSQMNIPSIEITKDMAIEDCNELDAFSDEDYDFDSRRGEMSVLKDSSSPRRMHRKPQDVSHHIPDTIHGPHRESQGRPFRRPPHKNNPSQVHPKKHYNTSTQGPISQGYQQHNDHSVRVMADRERQRKNVPSVQAVGSNHSHTKTDPVSYVNRNLSSVHHSGLMGNSGHLHKTMGSYSEEMEYNRHIGRTEELESNTGDNRVRVFVALFDYDPQTMSPNPDAADEELPFQEGQFIKIYGDKDIDGFYRGETNGQIGLVPGNMISEVQMGEITLPNELMNDNSPGRPHTLRALPVCDSRSDCNWSSKQVRKMYGLYDYDPIEVSPNVDSEVELSFKRGDVVYVIGEVGDDGFFLGEVNGIKGLVPSNFLTDTPPSPLQEEESHSLAPLGMGHITRPKAFQEECRFNQIPDVSSCNRDHRVAGKIHSTMWNEEEREPMPRGPHVPPRPVRVFDGRDQFRPTSSDKHW